MWIKTYIDSVSCYSRNCYFYLQDPARYIAGRWTITITNDDATQPHTQKMHSRIQTKSQEKINHLMDIDDIKLPKMKKNWKL